MPITLNHSNIAVQYETGSNYIIETVKSDLYRRNEIVDTIIRNNIQSAPVTPTTFVDNSGNVYAVESYTYSGTANTADFTRVFPKNTTCDILIVGGGGAGGTNFSGTGYEGGGGGAGGVVYMVNKLFTAGAYNISVGNGGTTSGGNGIESSIKTNNNNIISFDGINLIANGGGGGGNSIGKNGGSGGGSQMSSAGFGSSTQGNTIWNGTTYIPGGYNGSTFGTGSDHGNTAGGGGGAGGSPIGVNNGGNGIVLNITGANDYYAGGGGAAGSGRDGVGGLGGGGNPNNNHSDTSLPTPGQNGKGGGGGGGYSSISGASAKSGGNGGSGIVIIRYLLGTIPSTNYLTNEPVVIAPTFTETIRTFTHSGGTENQTTHTITIGQNTICDILIVGGGGGGGFHTGGGGGAGGYYYQTNITIPAGTYTINVGKGGNAGPDNNTRGSNGGDTTFYGITAKGGGGGASDNAPSGNNGGSGGGADWNGTAGLDTDTNTEGNDGGTPINIVGEYYGSGGGGAGSTGFTNGNGGSGKSNSITGTNTFYAAGGGGGRNQGTNWSGIGGSGIGGNGGNGTIAGTSGLNGTGSGGGGGGFITGGSAGSGGSGIVIIRFKSIANVSILDGITHKRLNFAYSPNYPSIQADNTNLKAWYKFDGNYMDSSPSGFNLTNSGATIVDGLIVQSVSTDSNDFLQTSGINLNGKTYSISFWLMFNTTLTTTNNYIFSQGATESPGLALHFLYESANNLRFSHWGGGNDIDTTGYNMANIIGKSWHHYVVTYNNTNRAGEIWFDGVKLNTNISTFANTFSGSGNFTIARSTLYGGTFNGLMEDFRYYDKILTSTEISQLYNIPTTNQYTLNFPVPTLADINNNSNIILRGAYDIALNTTNSLIIPKAGQYIPKPTTFSTSNLSIRYNILNPMLDTTGAQWTYNTSNTNVYHMGSVGIGTTNPEYQLDVIGTLNAKAYYFNGVQIGRLSEGMVANVQHLTYTHMEIKNNTGWDAINDDLTTGFVISITPKSNLSKILVNLVAHIGLTSANDGRWWGIKLYRKIGTAAWTEVTGPNGTETGSAATTAGTPVWISHNMGTTSSWYPYQIINLTGTYLDSPNTTSIVYYTAYWNQRIGDNPSRTGELWLNRAANQDDAYRPAPSSSWTVKEIWYG